MSKDNGGPAFPCSVRRSENYMDEGGYGRVRMVTAQEGGLSMRDYFAAKAMQGILATHPPASELGTFVQYAYRIADAMLKAREAA